MTLGGMELTNFDIGEASQVEIVVTAPEPEPLPEPEPEPEPEPVAALYDRSPSSQKTFVKNEVLTETATAKYALYHRVVGGILFRQKVRDPRSTTSAAILHVSIDS